MNATNYLNLERAREVLKQSDLDLVSKIVNIRGLYVPAIIGFFTTASGFRKVQISTGLGSDGRLHVHKFEELSELEEAKIEEIFT